jgi:zinc/manganese transport system substrate-binding protein/zinc transport system substrate-binding protein
LPYAQEHLAHGGRGEEIARVVTAKGNEKGCHGGPLYFRLLILLMGALALAAFAPVAPLLAAERLAMVTTTTDLKSLAEAVGGEHVVVDSIVPAGGQAEDYQPKPQDVSRLKTARLLVRVGLDFDLWLDKLVGRSGRADLGRGQPFHVDASLAITLLDVHAHGVGPGDGHAHGSGNPHYWLDPRNAEIITGHILERLAELDPNHAKAYEANRLRFLDRLDGKIKEWEEKLGSVKRLPVVAYHNTWAYLARRFRLSIVATIEQKPGVPPSPAHLNRLIHLMQQKGVRIIIREPREPEQSVAFLAAKTNGQVVVLAGSVGAIPQASDYLALFDWNVAALATAFGKR